MSHLGFLQAFTGFPTGALTYSFIQTLEQETKLTYGRLIMSMQNKIQETQKALGLNGANETQVRFYKIVNNKFKKISVSSSCLSNAFYWSCPGASTILIWAVWYTLEAGGYIGLMYSTLACVWLLSPSHVDFFVILFWRESWWYIFVVFTLSILMNKLPNGNLLSQLVYSYMCLILYVMNLQQSLSFRTGSGR